MATEHGSELTPEEKIVLTMWIDSMVTEMAKVLTSLHNIKELLSIVEMSKFGVGDLLQVESTVMVGRKINEIWDSFNQEKRKLEDEIKRLADSLGVTKEAERGALMEVWRRELAEKPKTKRPEWFPAEELKKAVIKWLNEKWGK